MNIKELIDTIKPPLESTKAMLLGKYDGDMSNRRLFSNGEITPEYNYWQTAYRLLVEQYVLKRTGLKSLDERLKKSELGFASLKEQSYSQAFSTMELSFFSIRNTIHVERLNKDEFNILARYIYDEVDDGLEDMISDTYAKVFARDTRDGIYVEYFKDIHGAGILPGDTIIFDLAVYCPATEDSQLHKRKYNTLVSIKKQLEPLLTKYFGVTTVVLIDY